jgi:hypothetical protein
MQISKNGIYILFENGEFFNGLDRVVRIGSHTGNNRLFTRINEHYINNDHRDSIFRKHLGRCFLTLKNRTDYIEYWDLKIKKRTDKEKNYHRINWEIEEEYEQLITEYIRNNFSFVVIPNLINEKERLRIEQGLISTFAQAREKESSNKWIGNYHPDNKIKTYKLWNIQHLLGIPLTKSEIELIEKKLMK